MSRYENPAFRKDFPFVYHKDLLLSIEKGFSNWHENIEFIYCISGKGRLVINPVPTVLQKGGLYLINSGDIHYIVSDSPQIEFHVFIVSNRFLKDFEIDTEKIHFCENITDSHGTAVFERLVRELTERPPYYQTVIRGEVLSYMAYLCRHYTLAKKSSGSNDRIRQGLLYIREHFMEDLSVEAIAKQAGYSPFYFSRQFKNVTGMTVMKYVESIRCRHAYEMLVDGMSVTKAAFECGFRNLSYFTKVFKQQYGILPSKVK